jgi:hypothetical protein
MKSVAKASGGEMRGLEFRYKSVKSMARKIDSKMEAKGISVDQAERGITDALRFTMILDTDGYVAGVQKARTEMEQQGYEVVESSNKWTDGSPYAGYHMLAKSPKGEVFELQFHTESSFEVKEGKLHAIYEKERNLPVAGSAAFRALPADRQQEVVTERNQLAEQMWSAAMEIDVPPTIERLPTSEEYAPPAGPARVGPRPQRTPRRKLPRERR